MMLKARPRRRSDGVHRDGGRVDGMQSERGGQEMTTRRSGARRHARRGTQPGQMMILLGLTMTILVGAMMLGVDLTHLRAEAENAQRAANAAALAGVIFLPDYASTAEYRALEVARQNGFSSGTNGVTVSASPESGYSNRLTVTITEPVSLVFGNALGLGNRTISRSATAEFYEPLEAGSPDNVLGYAPFPTTLVSPSAAEGFYLENKGPYEFKESGDAYSPLFESFSGQVFATPKDVPTPTGVSNSCALTTTTNGPNTCAFGSGSSTIDTTANDLRYSSNFDGYNYIIDDPFTNTLVVKLFDPYDEVTYNSNARSYDSAHLGTYYAPGDSSNIPSTAISSTNTSPTCLLGGTAGACNTKLIDQPSVGNNAFSSNPTTSPISGDITTLDFRLYGPGQSPYDQNMAQITATASTSTGTCVPATSNCVLSAPFLAGNDPTTCGSTSCSASPYAYHFLNFAVIHGPGIYRLNVRSEANSDGTMGTLGNAYGIAVCADSPAALYSGGAWITSDPFVNNGSTPGWNSASCANPNTTAPGACSNPANPGSGISCLHLYGLNKMAIHNWLSAGTSLIPLGYIPPEYGGKTLEVNLYDIGDVGGGPNSLEVLTPAGNLTNNVYGSTSAFTNTGYPASLAATYSSAPDNVSTGYRITGTTTLAATSSLPVSDNSSGSWVNIWNGTWLKIAVPLTLPSSTGKTYSNMVSQFGGYWKVLYNIQGAADDGTTWVISVAGSPVHLVSP